MYCALYNVTITCSPQIQPLNRYYMGHPLTLPAKREDQGILQIICRKHSTMPNPVVIEVTQAGVLVVT